MMLAVLATLTLSSSCVVRIDKKKMLENFNKDAEYGNGVYKVRDTTVQPFKVLTISGMLDVDFIQDESKCSVEIFASENVLPYVHVRQDGTVLKIYTRTPKHGTVVDSKMKITVHAPSLEAIDVSGMCEFDCSHLEVPDKYFKMDVSGASSVEFGTLVADQLYTEVSGASSAEVETLNVTGTAYFEISGKSSAELELINVGKVLAEVSGMSSLEIEKGKAGSASYEASGMSSVNAKGLDCSDTHTDASGMSDIKH